MNSNFLFPAATFNPNWLKVPYSWVGHIPFAAWLVHVAMPRIVVELGTHSGNSYFSICQAVKQYETDSKCFAVDTWQGDAHALSYGEEIYDMVRKHNEKYYASFSTLLRMTFDEALSKFDDRSVNLLHIDGLHTYDAVKHDFESWLPKLAPGAIVLFHDTNVRKDDFGVWKYWAELKSCFNETIDFSHSYGLGVLRIPHLERCSKSNDSILSHSDVEYFLSIGSIYESNGLVGAIDRLTGLVPWQLEALFIERESFRDRIRSMQGSFSWRLTSPLRYVDEMIRNFSKAG
jgi:hypothetical protein